MQTVNGVTINKLTFEQYKSLKANNQLQANESYVITDIDEQLDNLIIYEKSLDVNNPIILRNLSDGLYKIYGYFKYNKSQTGISGADPFTLVSIANGNAVTYAQFIDHSGNTRYEITDNSYTNMDDSGWIGATLESTFKPYNNNTAYKPEYRKVGKIVEIRGVVSPMEAIESSNAGVTMFTLPNAYRPSKIVYQLCQGSAKSFWLLTINVNGTVQFSRYGTTANESASATAWLTINAMYSVN